VVSTFSPSVLLRTARRTGVLDRHGLAVEEEPVPSSPAQFAALSDGTVGAALTSPDNVVAYRFLAGNPLGSTRDVRIVSAVDRGLGLGLYAAEGTPDAGALRGTKVGVDVAASGFAFALFAILERAGLGRDDYELVELGSTPRRLEALLEGRCTATMLNAGNDLKAEDAGLVRLADVNEVATPYLGTVLAVQGEPPAEVRALAEALR
jgi:ABC-type nitrate/sulfonate/bicarbonate transport system substrate-binding protein